MHSVQNEVLYTHTHASTGDIVKIEDVLVFFNDKMGTSDVNKSHCGDVAPILAKPSVICGEVCAKCIAFSRRAYNWSSVFLLL